MVVMMVMVMVMVTVHSWWRQSRRWLKLFPATRVGVHLKQFDSLTTDIVYEFRHN